jgi:hypothetical protein
MISLAESLSNELRVLQTKDTTGEAGEGFDGTPDAWYK